LFTPATWRYKYPSPIPEAVSVQNPSPEKVLEVVVEVRFT
jgi:hypothetical protein